MVDTQPRQVPVVRFVHDEHGERVVVSLEPRDEAVDLSCDCSACVAQLEADPTRDAEDASEFEQLPPARADRAAEVTQ